MRLFADIINSIAIGIVPILSDDGLEIRAWHPIVIIANVAYPVGNPDYGWNIPENALSFANGARRGIASEATCFDRSAEEYVKSLPGAYQPLSFVRLSPLAMSNGE